MPDPKGDEERKGFVTKCVFEPRNLTATPEQFGMWSRRVGVKVKDSKTVTQTSCWTFESKDCSRVHYDDQVVVYESW